MKWQESLFYIVIAGVLVISITQVYESTVTFYVGFKNVDMAYNILYISEGNEDLKYTMLTDTGVDNNGNKVTMSYTDWYAYGMSTMRLAFQKIFYFGFLSGLCLALLIAGNKHYPLFENDGKEKKV